MTRLGLAYVTLIAVGGSAHAQFVEQSDVAAFTAGLTDFAFEPFDLPGSAFDDQTLVFNGFDVSFVSGDFSDAGGQVLTSRLRVFGSNVGGDAPEPMVIIEPDRPVVAIGASMFGPSASAGVLIDTDGAAADQFVVELSGISGSQPPFLNFVEGEFYVLRLSQPASRIFIRNGGSFTFGITLDDVVLAFEPCLADTNGDGELTPADFNTWILAFNSGADACDQNGDGQCLPDDFNAWIANFNTSC